MKYVVLFILSLLSIKASTQSLIYNIQDPNAKTEKIFDNGALHVSKMVGSDLRIDSITPNGQIINLKQFPLRQDTLLHGRNVFVGYDYEDGIGVLTTYSLSPDMTYSYQYVRLYKHDDDGNYIFQRDISPTNTSHFIESYLPYWRNDSVMLYGNSNEEGDCHSDVYSVFLNEHAYKLHYKNLSYCGGNKPCFRGGYMIVKRKGVCQCHDQPNEPQGFSAFDNNGIIQSTFEVEKWYFDGFNYLKGVDLKPIDAEHVFGAVADDDDVIRLKNILVTYQNQSSQKWEKLDTILNYGNNQSGNNHTYQIIPFGNGYLAFIGQSATGFAGSTEYYYNTNLRLIELDHNFNEVQELWNSNVNGKTISGTITSDVTATGDTNIYLNIESKIGNSNSFTNSNRFVRIGNPSVVNSSKRKVHDNNFHVYPNPVNDRITIKGLSSGKYQFYNITGMVVKEGEINAEVSNVDVSDLTPGTYIIKTLQNSKTHHTKLIVK
ncbi:T9SS type A sorting domain-containing protein [Salibacter halophilus]|uniref:T9SS type A sorting domain-containing protein n=1 Tax=Salibacter halophilus TaxID=1803916 RepID=A0A6N6M699_9FLAO|nr:T9SS type A sorting domain-containing protein [Salibacter halophilus]KAB1063468.1 T9SS type A sorting domain-containing protein [Salibacter halophilus]